MDIVLYSTHCPKCNMIETKLKQKHINYTVNTNVDEMKQLGFHSMPVLKIDNQYLDFHRAYKWVMTAPAEGINAN